MEATKGSIGFCRGATGKGIIAGSGLSSAPRTAAGGLFQGRARGMAHGSHGAEKAKGRGRRVMSAASVWVLEGPWGQADQVPPSRWAEPGAARLEARASSRSHPSDWAGTPEPGRWGPVSVQPKPSSTGWGGEGRGKLSPVDPEISLTLHLWRPSPGLKPGPPECP